MLAKKKNKNLVELQLNKKNQADDFVLKITEI